MTLKSIIYVGIFTLFALLQNGCMLPAKIATDIENASLGKQVDQSKAVFIKHIAALQAKSDPLGDYYYALGNSDGWIKEVQDPQAITALFEKAATKGSMDARILLALQEASNDDKPGNLIYSHLPTEDLKGWESGLAKLLPLLQQQCYVRRLTVGEYYSEPRPQVSYYSIAYEIWPRFRNGYYRRNSDGTKSLLKDAVRQEIWEDIDHNCKYPSDDSLDAPQTR
jgi:hypothetical protein